MNYTLNQLRIFSKVAETLNITKAADDLFLTQPAVSIQLKNFQDQFDLPLYEIINKRFYLTDFGKEIEQICNTILNEIEEINRKTQDFKGLLTGKLKIAVVSTGKYIAPYLFSDFIKRHKDVELIMDVNNKTQVVKALENNQVDFALVSILPDQLFIDKMELLKNKLFLIGDKNFEIKNKKLDKNSLKNFTFIFREQGSATRQIMESYFLENKLKIEKRLELTSNEAVKQAVIAGLGISIMPIIGVKNELQNKELKIIPLKSFPIESSWNLIWLKDKKFSPVAKEFQKFINKEKDQIIQENFSWYESFLAKKNK